MKPYEKLAFLYEKDWGKFSLGYLDLLDHVFKSQNFTPSTILDIACGTGDLVLALNKRGYEVVGSDLSPEMIKISKTKNSDVEFQVSDMSELKLDRKFDLIICPFDSLNYLLSDQQLETTFLKVYEHLNDNGWFVFDVNTSNLYEEKHHGTIDRDMEGVKFKQVLRYDSEQKLAYTTFKFDNSETEKHVQKAYSKDEIIEKLNLQHFKVVETYENLNFDKATNKSNKVYVVAKKVK